MNNITLENNPIMNAINPNNIIEAEEVTESVTTTETEQAPQAELVKNYGGDLDPFIDVHKEPVYFQDKSQNPMVYGIRLGSQNKMLAGNVSADYLLVNNRDLLNIGKEIMSSSGINFEHQKRFFNNNGQFKDIYFAKDSGLEKPVREVGDLIGMVFEIQNSYNGTSKAGINLYFQRLACLNGMTSNLFGFGYTFKHSLGNIDWQDQIMKATSLLRNQSEYQLTQFVEACNNLQKPIDTTEIKSIRENYINKLPKQQFGQLMDKYLTDNDFTAWGLLNAGTNVLWHANKLTNANFSNNTIVTDGLLQYGKDTLEVPFVDPNQLTIPGA